MKGTCLLCNDTIYNFHASINCTGLCIKKIHLSCVKKFNSSFILDKGINIKDDSESKYNYIFTCSECNDINNITILNDNDNDSTHIEANDKFILEIFKIVKSMSNELKSLRAENHEIKQELTYLKRILSKDPDSSPKRNSPKNLPSVAKTSKQNVHPPPHTSKMGQTSNIPVEPSTSALNSLPSNTRTSINEKDEVVDENNRKEDEEGFTVVKSKKRRAHHIPPLQGCKKSNSLQIAKKKSPKKELFITRLDPETTSDDIEKFLLNDLNLTYAKCTKLKTKFDTYSSFHAYIETDEFHLVNHEDVWPDGILVKPFFGKLHSSPPKN